MPIRNQDHMAQYDVLIHSQEVAGEHEQWTSPSEPIIGQKIARTESGWVRQPWRTILQHGGLREQSVSFGPNKAQEFRNFLNSTPNSFHWSSDFKNDSTGLTCLRTWSRQCLDWCFDKYENGKFADQKYLDNWPITYRDQIVVSSNIGVGVAPWNVEGEQISYVKNHFYINSKPIIFYHFHGLKVLNRFLIKLGLRTYGTKPNKDLLKLYKDYINLIFSNGVLKKTKNIRTGGYSKLHLIASTIKNKDFLIKFSNIF